MDCPEGGPVGGGPLPLPRGAAAVVGAGASAADDATVGPGSVSPLTVRTLRLPPDAPGVLDGSRVWLRPGLEYVAAWCVVRALLPGSDTSTVAALVDQYAAGEASRE